MILGDTHLLVLPVVWVEEGYLWNYFLQQPNITNFLFSFSVTHLTIQMLFIEHVSFRVMCRERAWLFKSGIVFVQRKGVTFKIRHCLCTEKGMV